MLQRGQLKTKPRHPASLAALRFLLKCVWCNLSRVREGVWNDLVTYAWPLVNTLINILFWSCCLEIADTARQVQGQLYDTHTASLIIACTVTLNHLAYKITQSSLMCRVCVCVCVCVWEREDRNVNMFCRAVCSAVWQRVVAVANHAEYSA